MILLRKPIFVLFLLVAITRAISTRALTPPDCEATGAVRFVCGLSGPEDLVGIPASDWVIVSSREAGKGGLRAINARSMSTVALLPNRALQERLNRSAFPTCPGPIASIENEDFSSHGLYLRRGDGARHMLYVVHHGTRESVEVFEVDGRRSPPVMTWIGCAVAPSGLDLNSVVALPDGGFAATSFRMPNQPIDELRAGKISGAVWEWSSTTGWREVAGTRSSGPNGLEISADGRWFYIGAWGDAALIRVSRGRTPAERIEVSAGFRIDNVRAAPDGAILLAGQGVGPDSMPTTNVARFDTATLRVQEVIRFPDTMNFSRGTTALQVGGEVWVGSYQGDRIARFSLAEKH